jgi:hypothetical protein
MSPVALGSQAKLESKEASLLWIQKENAHLVWQAGELFSQKNKMSTKIKDWQVLWLMEHMELEGMWRQSRNFKPSKKRRQ